MIRFNLEEFISQHVTKRDESLLKADLEKFNKQLSERLTNKMFWLLEEQEPLARGILRLF